MKEGFLIAAIIPTLCFAGCSQAGQEAKQNVQENVAEEIVAEAGVYQQITAQEAKSMMDEQEDVLILDVREQSEYDEIHIPGAVLLPVGTITEETAAQVIPGKDSVVLVYCRSGRRSKMAAQALTDLGYTGIYEFGGIIDWPYEKE